MIFLIDQDGVEADFDAEMDKRIEVAFPGLEPICMDFYIENRYPEEYAEAIIAMYHEKGFYRCLQPIPGAIEGMNALTKHGDVYICTSPLLTNPHCVQEKYDWVEEHLGKEWKRRVIIAKNKRLVHGSVLVDDKPIIGGKEEPSWDRVVYDQPYNQDVPGRRMTWKNYEDVLLSR
jgi:5'-nucleotidase